MPIYTLALDTGYFTLTGNAATISPNQEPKSSFVATARLQQTARFHKEVSNTILPVKVGATDVYQIDLYNPNASVIWVQFLDGETGDLELGSSPPKPSYPIPANSVRTFEPHGELQYANGLCVAATTTRNGATAPASAAVVTIVYR